MSIKSNGTKETKSNSFYKYIKLIFELINKFKQFLSIYKLKNKNKSEIKILYDRTYLLYLKYARIKKNLRKNNIVQRIDIDETHTLIRDHMKSISYLIKGKYFK